METAVAEPVVYTPFVTRPQIDALVADIARRFHPERIILFGSYAYGTPREWSDVDLLIVMNHDGKNMVQANRIRSLVNVSFPLDLLVRKPGELETRLALGDLFLREIVSKGKIVYDAAHIGVG